MLMPWTHVLAVESHFIVLNNLFDKGCYITRYYSKGGSFYGISSVRPNIGSWYEYSSTLGKDINKDLKKAGLLSDMDNAFKSNSYKLIKEILLYLIY